MWWNCSFEAKRVLGHIKIAEQIVFGQDKGLGVSIGRCNKVSRLSGKRPENVRYFWREIAVKFGPFWEKANIGLSQGGAQARGPDAYQSPSQAAAARGQPNYPEGRLAECDKVGGPASSRDSPFLKDGTASPFPFKMWRLSRFRIQSGSRTFNFSGFLDFQFLIEISGNPDLLSFKNPHIYTRSEIVL